MNIICTSFDKQDVPLYSLIYNHNSIKFLPLYFKGINTKLYDVYKNLEFLTHIISSGPTIINDAISHFRYLDIKCMPNIYEIIRYGRIKATNEIQMKKKLCKYAIMMNKNIRPWMKIKGQSAYIYSKIEKRGIKCNNKLYYPKYDTKTFTGRSRTSGFNIQGATKEYPIEHPDNNNSIMIHFDWVSADIRMAGFLANDNIINNTFDNSDPYDYACKLLNNEEFNISRNECKIEILKSLYALNPNNPIIDLFPDLKEWVNKKIDEYNSNKVFNTIAGMPIGKGNNKSCFNAIIQGSVAESIQSAMCQIWNKYENILTETHDALIICSDKNSVDKWIKIGKMIMMNPLNNSDIAGPSMPVHVNIGKKWKNWKRFRTFRHVN